MELSLDKLAGLYEHSPWIAEQALARAEEVRSLQDKPADKLMSGLRLQIMTRAAKATGQRDGEAYTRFVAEDLRKSLDAMPFEVVANEVRELKAGAELMGETLIRNMGGKGGIVALGGIFNNVPAIERKAGLDEAHRRRRERIESWIDERARATKPSSKAELKATKTTSAAGETTETLSLALRLYHDDPAAAPVWQLETPTGSIPLEFNDWQTTDLREKVTVLDTGQRSHNNAALNSEVQAQTGYITFGKPTAAGSVERAWKVYTASTPLRENLIAALIKAERISLTGSVGDLKARIDFKTEQQKAWRRYANRAVDKVVD